MKTDALKILCLRYLDGDLNSQEAAAFGQLIATSQEAARMLARLAIHDSRFEVSTTLAFDREFELDRSDLLIDQMLRSKRQPPAEWALRIKSDAEVAEQIEPDHFSIREAMGVLGYVLIQSAHTKPAKWLAFSAAAILLVSIGWLVWGPESSTREQGPGPLAQAPSTPAPQAQWVATLTAERDAVWERRPGQGLFAGQRLTLTRGLAQIKTVSGAVAILEAPATIELLDNDNAIRLIVGRIVGRCESERSKGFTVYTRSARIVDIGTEFGVSVDPAGELEVHVLQGQVVVALEAHRSTGVNKHPPAPVTLTSNQAVRLSAVAQSVELISSTPLAFTQTLDPALQYAQAVMALGPVAYYRFESIGQDGLVPNAMGDRYHGKVVETVGLETSGLGNAARLTGEGYIQIDQTIRELTGAQRYTIECWVRPDQVHHGAIVSFSHETSDLPGSTSCTIDIHPAQSLGLGEKPQSLRFVHRNPPGNEGGTALRSADNQYTPGQWLHVVAVKNGPTMRLYIDGQPVSQSVDVSAMTGEAFMVLIGRNSRSEIAERNRPFVGLIDELALYDRALSPQEAARHYAIASSALTPGTTN